MYIAMFVFFSVAAIMFGIGLSQYKSRTPVGFYSGINPPLKEKIKDITGWNHKHGMMWMIYGILIMIASFSEYYIDDDMIGAIPIVCGVILPLFLMMIYHGILEKEYLIK